MQRTEAVKCKNTHPTQLSIFVYPLQSIKLTSNV